MVQFKFRLFSRKILKYDFKDCLCIFFRPGPNNTIIITFVVNGTNVPNITWPIILNITTQPTKSRRKK
jgi:hypothetical protein